MKSAWSVDDAAELYHVRAWGGGYFDVGANGHLVVRPDGRKEHEIDLLDVVEGLRHRSFAAPVLIRFSDIVAHRIRRLHEAFKTAIDENGYQGRYAPVYPIKVNQQRAVVEEVYRYGAEVGCGLEVGSKPELLAVMGTMAGDDDRLILCNGFKDEGYLEAAVLASKLGRRIIPIIENLRELDVVLRHARRYGVRPQLGVRIKLASQGAGRWRDSSGVRSKFGLFVNEVLAMLARLRELGMEDCLQLVHCHAGSQLPDIRRVKEAVAELAHVYAELCRLGAGMKYIDVGGGLGVDYDGSRTNFSSSMNYSLEEYASEIVYRIGAVCDEKEVPHPTIISESGRAIAAYHSVLVFDVLGRTALDRFPVDDRALAVEADEDLPQPVRDLVQAYEAVDDRRLLECYHDAVEAREQALHLFNAGFLTLEQRGLAERLFWATCSLVRDRARLLDRAPDELTELETILSDTYFCNFSVFQSMPDGWAIDQVFPVMPIHRLAEKPVRKAVIADLTCDSDGRIDRFIDARGVRRTIDLHELRPEEPYYLAAFLVGAYQETLGDLHNLFGDTHVVHVRRHDDGGWWIEEAITGDSAAEVLAYVQYDARRLRAAVRRDCEEAVRAQRMTLEESQALLRFYEQALSHYTYLDPAEGAGHV